MNALLFLYFLLVSCELLHIQIAFFRIKLSALVALIACFCFILFYRLLRFERDFFSVALGCVGALVISALYGANFFACFGFIVLFIFNYLVFFVFPGNLFFVFRPNFILKIYFSGFFIIGMIAALQVGFSLLGVYLPFATQKIGILTRGQGLSYEPSYYALYMTPFAIFHSVKFAFEQKRKLRTILVPNLFLFLSTSASCFFSYFMLLLGLVFFYTGSVFCKHKDHFFSLLKNNRFLFAKQFSRISFGVGFIGLIFWYIQPQMITRGLFKYTAYEFLISSFGPRWEGIKNFWQIFLDHPFLGVGLGGGTTYYAQKEGLEMDLFDSDILDLNCAMNVATELLGSLGLIGGVFFSGVIFITWKNCKATLRCALTEEEKIQVISLICSLGVLFFSLQCNQSIMRAYTWMHVGICIGIMKYYQRRDLLKKATNYFKAERSGFLAFFG